MTVARALLTCGVLVCMLVLCHSEVVSLDPADGGISAQHADQQDNVQAASTKQNGGDAADAAGGASDPDSAAPAAGAAEVATASASVLAKEVEQTGAVQSAQQEPEVEPAEGGKADSTDVEPSSPEELDAAIPAISEEQLQRQAVERKALQPQAEESKPVPTKRSAVSKGQEVTVSKKSYTGKFHKIPGMTIDAPAITRMVGVNLKDCTDACTKVHLCTGVQFSDDTKLEGGNCLLMAQGMQFSQTFDYYERPGVTLDMVEKTDQQMAKKWRNQDDSQSDLGGLSVEDIPGAHKINTKKIKEEVSRFKALHEVKAAVQKIDKHIEEQRQAKLNHLHKQLGEARKDIVSTKARAGHLRERTEAAGAHSIELSKQYESMRVRSAQLNVKLAEYAEKSSKAQDEVHLAGTKVEEYKRAYRAYDAAGNPLAQKMREKFEKWGKGLSAAKMNLLNVRKQRLDLKAQVDEANSKAKRLEQESAWARSDYKSLGKKADAEDKLHQMSLMNQHHLKEELHKLGVPRDSNEHLP